MVVALPDLDTPATLILSREHSLTDEEYFAFCASNPDLQVERTARGEIIIVPPVGLESDFRCHDVGRQLGNWAVRDGRGKAFGSTGQFILPNGAGRSPDAAWISNERLSKLPKAERKKFVHTAPEFVVEVLSPSDRLNTAKAKMSEWIDNGVQLGWLIDGDNQTVHIYRAGQPPEVQTGINTLAGEGPVEGFVLDLEQVWEGL